MPAVAQSTSSCVVAWGCSFLRWHIAHVLRETEELDVWALDELRRRFRPYLHGANQQQINRLMGLVNRRQFFYRVGPDERLYVPVLVKNGPNCPKHPTDLATFEEHRQAYRQSRRKAREERKPAPPLPRDPSFESYHELSELLASMHRHLRDPHRPDARGVVLVTRSGGGKSVACRKAFYDCFFGTPVDTRDGSEFPVPRLAGFLPCWALLQGEWDKPASRDNEDAVRWAYIVLLRTAGLVGADECPSLDDPCIRRLKFWLRHGPPLLVFVDLNRVGEEARVRLANAWLRFQQIHGPYGHRVVITLRSLDLEAGALGILGTADRQWFGFYDLQPLDAKEAEGYLHNLRLFEFEIERAVNLQPAETPEQSNAREQQSEARLGRLCELIARHIRENESLISTPLLMHFLGSLRDEQIEALRNLTDLYRFVIDNYLQADRDNYGDQLVVAGLGRQDGSRRLLLTAMTRAALAIRAQGADAVRIPFAVLLQLLENPEATGPIPPPPWIPQDKYWHASPYYDGHIGKPIASTTRESATSVSLPRLLEFSLLRREGESVGFLHDSLIDYFVGGIALAEPWGPDAPTTLDEIWCQKVVQRIVVGDAVQRTPVQSRIHVRAWASATEFLAGRLVAASLGNVGDHRDLLGELARRFVLAPPTPGLPYVVERLARGANVNPAMAHLERSLSQHAEYLDRWPGQMIQEAYNTLTTVSRRDLHNTSSSNGSCRLATRLADGSRWHPPSYLPWLRCVLRSMPQLVQVKWEHAGAVNCLATTDDGAIVSGSDDKTVRIWDVRTGVVETIIQHDASVTSVAVLQGDVVLSGSADGTLKLWDKATRDSRTLVENCGSSIIFIAPTCDERIAFVGSDGAIRIVDQTTREIVSRLNDIVDRRYGPPSGRLANPLLAVRTLADGSMCAIQQSTFAIAKEDGVVWPPAQAPSGVNQSGQDVSGGSATRHGMFLCAVNDRVLAFTPGYGLVSLSLSSDTCEVISRDIAGITCVLGLTDGQVAWIREEGDASVYAPQQSPMINPLSRDRFGEIAEAAIQQGGVVWVCDEWEVVQHDWAGDSVYTTKQRILTQATGITKNREIVWLSSAPYYKHLKYYDLARGGKPKTCGVKGTCAARLPDGRVAVGGTDGSVRVIDFVESEEAGMCCHSDAVRCLVFLDQERFVSGGEDSTVRLWEVRSGQSRIITKHDRGRGGSGDRQIRYDVHALTVLAGGKIPSVSRQRNAALERGAIKPFDDSWVAGEILADGRVLCMRSGEGCLAVWDPIGRTSEEPIFIFRDREDWHQSVVQALDNDRLVVGDGSGCIRIFDPIQKTPMVVGTQRVAVTALEPLSDGRIVSGGADAVRVWDEKNGEVACCPVDVPVTALACAPGLPRIAVGLENGGVLVLDLMYREVEFDVPGRSR